MLSWMNGWFSNLKVPDKSADMKMMSEGLEYGRFLDKWMKYLCLRFRLFSFLLPEDFAHCQLDGRTVLEIEGEVGQEKFDR